MQPWSSRAGAHAGRRLLLLDVPIGNAAEERFVDALVRSASSAFATTPGGDERSRSALESLGSVEEFDAQVAEPPQGFARVRRYLFAAKPPPGGDPLDEVELFSAPGEGRECVEIARRVLREARGGVPFDRMAVVRRV